MKWGLGPNGAIDKQRNVHDLALSGANETATSHYEAAIAELQCYWGDPLARVDVALVEAPGFVMSHALRAWLHLLGTEPGGLPVARAALIATECLPATSRERGHLAATRHLSEGRWHAAGRVMEDVTIDAPRDELGLLAGHQIDFLIPGRCVTASSGLCRIGTSRCRAITRCSGSMDGGSNCPSNVSAQRAQIAFAIATKIRFLPFATNAALRLKASKGLRCGPSPDEVKPSGTGRPSVPENLLLRPVPMADPNSVPLSSHSNGASRP